jgi:tetratricopeptide (TPR) repeat protein
MRPRSLLAWVRGLTVSGGIARAATVALLGLSLACPGCVTHSPKDEQATLLARSQALIDSGNAAYRAQDYGLAAKRYAAASSVKKDDPAAWFGLGMALAKLGRDEEARAAYARARELTQEQQRRP